LLSSHPLTHKVLSTRYTVFTFFDTLERPDGQNKKQGTKGGFPFSSKCCAIDFLRLLPFEIQTFKRKTSH
jgi:hypothetical protein